MPKETSPEVASLAAKWLGKLTDWAAVPCLSIQEVAELQAICASCLTQAEDVGALNVQPEPSDADQAPSDANQALHEPAQPLPQQGSGTTGVEPASGAKTSEVKAAVVVSEKEFYAGATEIVPEGDEFTPPPKPKSKVKSAAKPRGRPRKR